MSQWFQSATENLIATKWYTWAVIIALVALAAALIVTGRKSGAWTSRRLAAAAMTIAISFVLSSIRLFRVPQGGSVTPLSMLPIIAFSLSCGPAQGALVGCAYGILQLIQDPYVVHPLQILVDYPLAFGALALGAFAKYLPVNKALKLPLAVVLASLGRYAMAVLSGTVFFAEYAPVGQTALAYSLVYNISYLGPDALLCFVMAFIPGIARITDLIGSVPAQRTRA